MCAALSSTAGRSGKSTVCFAPFLVFFAGIFASFVLSSCSSSLSCLMKPQPHLAHVSTSLKLYLPLASFFGIS